MDTSWLIRLLTISLVFLLTLPPGLAQVNSYFVYFTDKEGTPFTISAPNSYLTQKALDRRAAQGISVSEADLPVTPTYVDALTSVGSVSVRYTSRWFNGAIIQASPVDAETVKQLFFVEAVEYIAPDNVGGRIAGNDKFEAEDYPQSDTLRQFSLLEVDQLRAAGIDGAGQLIAVIDGGFTGVNNIAPFQHLFDNGQVLSTFDFLSGSPDVYRYSSHGTEVLSLMAASRTNPDYLGIIPKASFLLFVTENAAANVEYRIEEYWWLIAAEKADSLGADIITTSVGYYDFLDPSMNYSPEDLDGKTAVITRAAQAAADRGIVFVTSAGNAGNKPWQKITFPADIIDGLAVGSMLNEFAVSGFSSVGPSADNRIKPDVMALGSGAYVVTSDGRIVNKSGTSFTAPQVTALAAALWQSYPELTAREIIEAIRFSASNAIEPNDQMGYGIPSFRALVNYVEHFETDNWVSLYPNPTAHDLYVYLNNPAVDSRVEISLFNSNGQPLLISNIDITWKDNQYILDVSTLPRGIYVLNLQSTSNFSQLKFAKL